MPSRKHFTERQRQQREAYQSVQAVYETTFDKAQRPLMGKKYAAENSTLARSFRQQYFAAGIGRQLVPQSLANWFGLLKYTVDADVMKRWKDSGVVYVSGDKLSAKHHFGYPHGLDKPRMNAATAARAVADTVFNNEVVDNNAAQSRLTVNLKSIRTKSWGPKKTRAVAYVSDAASSFYPQGGIIQGERAIVAIPYDVTTQSTTPAAPDAYSAPITLAEFYTPDHEWVGKLLDYLAVSAPAQVELEPIGYVRYQTKLHD
jgi:hypothetical protein